MEINPVEYKLIPTQYRFLVEKTPQGYTVTPHILTKLEANTFQTEKEARAFINKRYVL